MPTSKEKHFFHFLAERRHKKTINLTQLVRATIVPNSAFVPNCALCGIPGISKPLEPGKVQV